MHPKIHLIEAPDSYSREFSRPLECEYIEIWGRKG